MQYIHIYIYIYIYIGHAELARELMSAAAQQASQQILRALIRFNVEMKQAKRACDMLCGLVHR